MAPGGRLGTGGTTHTLVGMFPKTEAFVAVLQRLCATAEVV